MLPIALLLLADLTGLWYAPPRAADNNKRDLYLALRTEGDRVTGEAETPTRNAPIVDGRVSGDGSFSGILASIWDGKPARRPIEGRLEGEVLRVRMQAWPEGPMVAYELRKVSDKPEIAKITAVAPPELRELPSNGLAKTPPMGWNSWKRFGCRVNDQMIREMADALVSSGMKAAGYEYINIDDCWQAGRNADGSIRPNPERFPDMKALADYVHGKGLKLGIYSSPGTKTCAGFDGSYGHEEQDARTWAAWGIDLVKYDWCSAGKLYSYDQMRAVYQKMGAALQATGRPMVYSICQYGLAEVWKWGPLAGGNLWRSTTDIGDNWKTVSEIGFEKQLGLSPFAGPGRWNDPDMLEVGNGGMSTEEYRAHMSLWALLAAPLLAGNDLRTMAEETRSILMNPDVIAIDQDRLGRQAERTWKRGHLEVWMRPLADGGFAVGVFNRGTAPAKLSLTWPEVGVKQHPASVRDVWRRTVAVNPALLDAEVAGHGVVLLRGR